MLPFAETWRAVRRLLVVRLDNIGDVVMLSPALRALQANLPSVQITLLASPAGAQAASLLPWVHDVIPLRSLWQDVSGTLPFDPAREQALVDTLRDRSFQAAVIFTSFSQSPYPPAYVAYLAGIPLRLGHSKEFGGGVLSHENRPPADSFHQVDRNLLLLENAGFSLQGRHLELSIPDEATVTVESLLQAAGLDPHQPYIVAAPGASCASRRYDLGRFAQVIRELSSQAGLPVVIAGSEREAGLIQPVVQVAGEANPAPVISLVGQTSVPEFAALIRPAALVIANNSSALHFADAFRRPVVVLYSGTELTTQWQPRFSPSRLLRQETACSPCYRFECPFNMECLDIPPREVLLACLELLSTGSMGMDLLSEERASTLSIALDGTNK